MNPVGMALDEKVVLGYGNLKEQEIKILQVYQNPNSFPLVFYLYHHY